MYIKQVLPLVVLALLLDEARNVDQQSDELPVLHVLHEVRSAEPHGMRSTASLSVPVPKMVEQALALLLEAREAVKTTADVT